MVDFLHWKSVKKLCGYKCIGIYLFFNKKKKKFSWGYGCGKKILTFFIRITVCDTYTSLLTPNLKLKSTLWRFIDNVVQKFWTLTDSHARALVLGYSSGITFITTGDRLVRDPLHLVYKYPSTCKNERFFLVGIIFDRIVVIHEKFRPKIIILTNNLDRQ